MDKGLLDLLIKVKTGWLSPEYVAQVIEEQNEIKLLKAKLNQAS